MVGAPSYTLVTATPTATAYFTDWMYLSLASAIPVHTYQGVGEPVASNLSLSATLGVKF